MSDATYNFVYDRASADTALHGIAARELVLSILATMPPESSRGGCIIYRGSNPIDETNICLATQCPAAHMVQLRLIEASSGKVSAFSRCMREGPRSSNQSPPRETENGRCPERNRPLGTACCDSLS